MKIKYKINSYVDRERIILGFANAGYRVCVEHRHDPDTFGDDFYVVVDGSPSGNGSNS